MAFWNKKNPVAASPVQGAGEVDSVDAPWTKAGLQYNDTFLRLDAHAANWRRQAFLGWVIVLFAVGGMIYIGSKSKFVPYVVEVDQLGRTVAVRALVGSEATTDTKRTVYREMFDLIENLRTVTTDRMANDDRIEKGFSRLDGAAYAYARAELKKALPNDIGATKTVQVKVNTALKLTEKSWQIEWEERSFNLAGESIGLERWKATVQYDLRPSGEVSDIRKNPIGFTVSEMNWMKVI